MINTESHLSFCDGEDDDEDGDVLVHVMYKSHVMCVNQGSYI